MTERVSADDIPSILERLVDSWYAVQSAQALREEFRRTVGRPTPPPGGFDDVSALQDYHRRLEDYQTGQNNVERDVNEAKQKYKQAAEQVRGFLPRGNYVRFIYQGRHQEPSRNVFIIRHQAGGQISVEYH